MFQGCVNGQVREEMLLMLWVRDANMIIVQSQRSDGFRISVDRGKRKRSKTRKGKNGEKIRKERKRNTSTKTRNEMKRNETEYNKRNKI